jgi:hypothetical protein
VVSMMGLTTGYLTLRVSPVTPSVRPLPPTGGSALIWLCD